MSARTTFLLAAALLAGGCTGAAPVGEVLVGAAASLSAVLPDLTAAYERETGRPVTTTVGSSGQLTQQIRQGAPIAVFLSADVPWVDSLAAGGFILPESRAVYARGRLALWSRDTAAAFTRIEDLLSADVGRIAIANPAFAPYGRAAREALGAAGLWNEVEPRLVIAENVRQALQFAETGNVDVAFVAHTLVRDAHGHAVLVPDTLYTPLDQALGVVAAADTAAAGAFARFVLGPVGRAILQQHGFVVREVP